MRVGILTGGGDVPGLNPCIKAVVNRVCAAGHEVVGLRRGWSALLAHDLDDHSTSGEWFQELTPAVVRTIDRTGGTFLHTSRTNPSRVRASEVPAHLAGRAVGEGPDDFTDHALRVVERLGLDVLIPIGGDDTLSYALRLHDEGVPVIAIPKTMDTTSTAPTTASASRQRSPAASSSSTTCARPPARTSASPSSSSSAATAARPR